MILVAGTLLSLLLSCFFLLALLYSQPVVTLGCLVVWIVVCRLVGAPKNEIDHSS